MSHNVCANTCELTELIKMIYDLSIHYQFSPRNHFTRNCTRVTKPSVYI